MANTPRAREANPEQVPHEAEHGGGAPAARVLARVRAIPPGFVRTYGDLSPGAPRLAGAVLAAAEEPGLPWHRVVRADGTLAKGERQRRLLEGEGIPFKGERGDMGAARPPDQRVPRLQSFMRSYLSRPDASPPCLAPGEPP